MAEERVKAWMWTEGKDDPTKDEWLEAFSDIFCNLADKLDEFVRAHPTEILDQGPKDLSICIGTFWAHDSEYERTTRFEIGIANDSYLLVVKSTHDPETNNKLKSGAFAESDYKKKQSEWYKKRLYDGLGINVTDTDI